MAGVQHRQTIKFALKNILHQLMYFSLPVLVMK